MTQPYVSSEMEVLPAWIDYNGHLNMAYYNVLFDTAADEFYAEIGFGEDYAKTRGFTTYTAEFHLCYIRELHQGDKVRVHSRVIDHDAKRFHTYQEIWHEDGWLAATGEALGLHIDMSGPRVAVMPDDIQAALGTFAKTYGGPRPERAGRSIGIPRK